MCSSDLPDRFVIRPTLYPEWAGGYDVSEKGLTDGFRYSSDNNTEWLDASAMRAMLAATRVDG